VRELPRQLSADELAELFGGRSRLVERLAEVEHPLAQARAVAHGLSEEEQVEALSVHPRIGESSPEQRGDEPEVLAELAELNRAYEERFGFRFIVFVDGRPRAALVPVLRNRLKGDREAELRTSLNELVSIAEDRWSRG
jgi:2-oxo-4-hydroxy-4-carboxy--5-ureidoimidazoline (OHCU) decarboxylase